MLAPVCELREGFLGTTAPRQGHLTLPLELLVTRDSARIELKITEIVRVVYHAGSGAKVSPARFRITKYTVRCEVSSALRWPLLLLGRQYTVRRLRPAFTWETNS
jgi:hypothetical protein